MLPEGWEATTLGKIMDFRNGLNFSKSDSKNLIKVVGVSDFSLGNVLSRADSLKETYVDQFKDDDLLIENDFLFVRSNGNKSLIGRCLYFPYVPEPISFSGFTIRGRLKGCSISANYIFQIVAGEYFRKHINLSGSGTNISNLSQEILSNTPLILPPLPEQKKIAAILSTWDRAIEGTEKLLANSQQQKKALMQQLLTGKKRLPGFTGEWEKHRLCDCCHVVMGSSPKSEFYNETGEGLPLLQGNADIKNRLSCPRIFTSEITKECQLGDILLSVRAPVGTVSIALHHACIGRGISSIRVKKGNSQEFAYQYFLSIEDRWERLAQGSTFEAVNGDDIKKLTILLPSFPEQKAIAAVLTTADEEITALESDLSRLRQEKKALMQQLLTGKIRVAV
ncbi:restriction endonuclease subunit S [Gluconacetobacter entanii]|uniref:Restriction endonuclease subunit S n=1 Tax=Gluconacetobacter entanii TaxID=108528 RepID=A0A318Q870_9PROT|nr:restriction endonuclease subunit S [Gluconacetobacter entanii]PYD61162.1 restriction endonuclease subunit S [Gluconacetobacter entanii]